MKIYAIVDFDEDLGVYRIYHFKSKKNAETFFESKMYLFPYGTEIDEYEFLDDHGKTINEIIEYAHRNAKKEESYKQTVIRR